MPCLTSAQLSLFLEDRLAAAERDAAEEHLSQCATCRHQLVASHDARLAHEMPAPEEMPTVPDELKQKALQISRRQVSKRQPAQKGGGTGRWWAIAAVLLVSALGLTTLDFDRKVSPSVVDDPNALRSGNPGQSGSSGQAGGSDQILLQAISPADGAVVTEPSLELRWTAVPGARRYTLTLLDSLGNILSRTTTTEDHATVDPRQVEPPVEPGSECFWYVTAQLADGGSVESAVRGLTWSP